MGSSNSFKMDTKISSKFWNDEALATPELKLAALWLKTNANLSLIGYGELHARRFVFDTGLAPELLDLVCNALGEAVIREGKGYWLRDFIAEQFGRGVSLSRNHMSKPLVRALQSLGFPWIEDAVLLEYPELIDISDSLAQAKGSESPRTEHTIASHSKTEHTRVIGGSGGKNIDGRRPRSTDDVLDYARQLAIPEDRARNFFDHYEANGWRQGGRIALRSWRAALRLYQSRAVASEKLSGVGGAVIDPEYDPKAPNATTGGVEVSN